MSDLLFDDEDDKDDEEGISQGISKRGTPGQPQALDTVDLLLCNGPITTQMIQAVNSMILT